MKKKFLKIITLFLTVSAILTGCYTPSEKVEKAQENVTEANKDLDKTQEEYLVDVENYRREADKQIASNDQQIAEFKLRMKHDKEEAKISYKKRIDELETRNREMKKKMDEYHANGKENWEAFKSDFKQGMEDIGASLKDLTGNHPNK